MKETVSSAAGGRLRVARLQAYEFSKLKVMWVYVERDGGKGKHLCRCCRCNRLLHLHRIPRHIRDRLSRQDKFLDDDEISGERGIRVSGGKQNATYRHSTELRFGLGRRHLFCRCRCRKPGRKVVDGPCRTAYWVGTEV